VHLHEGTRRFSTVVLIDLSGSMMRYGRFMSAKRWRWRCCAPRAQPFPQDTIDFVGFYSGAQKIPEIGLPLMMPKPVTVYDYQVRLKVPIAKLDQAPQHFTNLHMGLQMARRILRKRPSENKQIFIITDGQPTGARRGDHRLPALPPGPGARPRRSRKRSSPPRRGAARDVRPDRRLLRHGLGRLRRPAHRLTRRGLLHQQRRGLANCIMESYLSGTEERRRTSREPIYVRRRWR
jgi:hypothetical protein